MKTTPVLGLLLLFALVVVFTATVGNTNGSRIPPDVAIRVSHVAVLAPRDLPDGAWRTMKRDNFDAEQEAGPFGSTACRSQQAIYDIVLRFRSVLAGRAQIDLVETSSLLHVEEWVEVYRTPRDVLNLHRLMQDYLGDNYIACTNATLLAQGLDLQPARVAMSTSLRPGTLAIAFEYRLANDPVARRAERYYWVAGNVGVSLLIDGSIEDLANHSQAILDAARANLEQAAKAKWTATRIDGKKCGGRADPCANSTY